MASSDAIIVNPALLFGLALDLILFGILTAQAYVYYISFPNDRMLLKIAVVWVYLTGVAQTGLALLDIIILFIEGLVFLKTNIGSFQPDLLWLSITALSGAVAIVIQTLYAHRIYLISKKYWLATMILCMSLGQFVSSIIGAVCFKSELALSLIASIRSSNSESQACYDGFTIIWGPINIACDLTITICMVTFLLRHRRKIIMPKTRSHIAKIVQIVIETGMATTVLMIIYTILFILWNSVQPGVFNQFMLPGLMMSKVYSNSMLVLLNRRATIANGRNTVEPFEFVEVSARGLGGDIELRTTGR